MPAMAAAVLMLAACASSPGADRPRVTPGAVATVVTERLVCPPDLYADLPARPRPAPGAVVDANEAGKEYLKALGSYGNNVAQVIIDTRAACAAAADAGTPPGRPPASPPPEPG